jgi:hypothetical protein
MLKKIKNAAVVIILMTLFVSQAVAQEDLNISKAADLVQTAVQTAQKNADVAAAAAAADTVKAPDVKKDPNWKVNGTTGLRFVQSSYNNWAAGGENTVAGTAAGHLTFNYAKGKVSWVNDLDLKYGLAYQGSKRSKTDDKIDFLSNFGYKAFDKVYYTAQFTFRSQFDKGYASYPVTDDAVYTSRFMAPAYAVLALGLTYKPSDDFLLTLSPLSGKSTYVFDDLLSDLGAFGVTPGKHAYYEFGAYLNLMAHKKFSETFDLRTKLDLFSNLLKHPENIDINWTLELNMRVTKYITATFGFELRYDDDTHNVTAGKGPAVQLKQTFGIGFDFTF